MVISTEGKKSIQALSEELSELKAQLDASRRWSKAWKDCCLANKRAHTETILTSTDLLEPVIDHGAAMYEEIYNSMAVSALGEIDQSFEVHIIEQHRVAAILRAVKEIRNSVEQCLSVYSQQFNHNQKDEPQEASVEVKRPLLRLVHRKNQ